MFQIKSFLLDCTSGPGFGEYYMPNESEALNYAKEVYNAIRNEYCDLLNRYKDIISQYLIECMKEKIKDEDSPVGTISFPLSISHLHVDEMQTRDFSECYDRVKEYYNYIATE